MEGLYHPLQGRLISVKTGNTFFWGSCLLLIRLLTLITALPLRFWVWTQRTRGIISAHVADNRLGRPTISRTNKPVIWIHAASLGELSAVRPFLVHLVQTKPNHCLLITTNNPTALDIAAGWRDIPALLQTAPLDIPSVVEKFLNYWHPMAFVNIETEVWPNRFRALAKHNIQSIGLNARLSTKSAKRFAKLGSSVGLHHFKVIFAQNETSAQNYQNILGPDSQVEVIPNFKSLVQLPATDQNFAAQFDRCKTILAASTHPGEDEIILTAFSKLVAQDNTLKLILAPRHPHRATEINSMTKLAGLVPKILGSTTSGSVCIVDSLGQLPHLYGLASVTLVGGSLVPNIGGHTPYEPIRAHSAIVTGQETANFVSEFTRLNAAKACIITKPDMLDTALQKALESAETLAQNASRTFPEIYDPKTLLNKISTALNAQT